jgi:hypothetical protein
MSQCRHWDMESRGREAAVTPLRSRDSVAAVKEPENQTGMFESRDDGIPIRRTWEVTRDPV